MIIKVSWLKYILASLGPIFIVTGIADRNLSNVMVGLRPQWADTLLHDIHNGFLKDLASKLSGSAKTVNELLAVVKAVVASAVDSQTGDPLYPRLESFVHRRPDHQCSEAAMRNQRRR